MSPPNSRPSGECLRARSRRALPEHRESLRSPLGGADNQFLIALAATQASKDVMNPYSIAVEKLALNTAHASELATSLSSTIAMQRWRWAFARIS